MIELVSLVQRLVGAAVVVAVVSAGTPDPTPHAGDNGGAAVPLRLAYFANVTHAPALVGVQRGLFTRALGESAPLETKAFSAGPALIEALLAGDIDIGYVGPNPALNGYVRSRGEALRIIAGASSGGALFVVRPDAGIAKASDLAGKTIATPQRGGTQDVALRHYLQKNGLETADLGGNVTVVPTANPDILTLFRQGQIHGAWVPEPWGTRLLLEAGGRVFIDERREWPSGQFVTTVVVASTKVLRDRPQMVRAFLGAHVDAVDFIRSNDGAAQQAVNAEIARITTRPLPAAVVDGAFTNVEFTYQPLAATLHVQAGFAFDLGFLGRSRPDLGGLFELSFLNDVLRTRQRTLDISQGQRHDE